MLLLWFFLQFHSIQPFINYGESQLHFQKSIMSRERLKESQSKRERFTYAAENDWNLSCAQDDHPSFKLSIRRSKLISIPAYQSSMHRYVQIYNLKKKTIFNK